MAPRATMPSERGRSELQACFEAFDPEELLRGNFHLVSLIYFRNRASRI